MGLLDWFPEYGISPVEEPEFEGIFKNLKDKQADFAAEEILNKHLKFISGELLLKLFLAIKKELLERNQFEEVIKKDDNAQN